MMSVFEYLLVIILVVATFGLCLLVLHKARRIHLMQYNLQWLLEQEKSESLYRTYQQLMPLNCIQQYNLVCAEVHAQLATIKNLGMLPSLLMKVKAKANAICYLNQ